MSHARSAVAEVFTVQEIARAAGVPADDVRRMVDAGRITMLERDYLRPKQAIQCVRLLRSQAASSPPELFATPAAGEHNPGGGLLASGAVHAAMLAGLLLFTTLGLTSAIEQGPPPSPTRLVFLATPGPGGGGGGGGLRQRTPPARAKLAS
ncbi:MAG: type IV toxin-antitoxin system AbiEi family antitoxin domain-containing protein, partial [Vicinamibacterales bacterium]